MGVLGLLGMAVLVSEACSLDANGLASATPEAGVGVTDTAPPTIDSPPVPTDTGADVARDAACATLEIDCLDGIDNDCNGLVDCADPACTAGYVCAELPTDGGFEGTAIYAPTRATPCPSTYPTQTDTFEGLLTTPAECSACSCAAGGASCGVSAITCGAAAASCALDGGASAVVTTTCGSFDAGALGPGSSCAVTVPEVTPGTCVPDGGAATLPDASFSELSRVCTTTSGPGGGCAPGLVCVGRPPSGFHGACVFKSVSGAAVCPAGFGQAHVTMPSATSVTDTRGCTACSCGSPTGASCAGAATFYSAPGCTDDAGASDAGAASLTLTADGVCHGVLLDASLPVASIALDASVASQGTCTPSGGEPTGSVTPTNETLYCCPN
jgi:hypothetical protein